MDLQLSGAFPEINTEKQCLQSQISDEITHRFSLWDVRFWCVTIAYASNVATDAITIVVILQKRHDIYLSGS